MQKRYSLPGLLLCLSVACSSRAAENPITPSEAKIDRMVEQFIERRGVPGISVALGSSDEVLLAKAYGLSNVEHEVPATTDTVFRTASICKMFTAVAILQLAEQEKLDLDEPVASYFPELDKNDWTFTTRQLLGHLAGVRHYKSSNEPRSTRYFPDVQSALVTFVNDPLLHDPGSQYKYTTFGYNLLGAIVERQSGQDYADYIDQHIGKRASMPNTQVDNHFRIIPHRSAGYMRMQREDNAPMSLRRDFKRGELCNAALHDTSMKVPGGGMLSTPTDLFNFAKALLGGKLVTKETMQEMWTEQQTSDGDKTSYGLGFRLYDDDQTKLTGHSGGQCGVSTQLLMNPKTGNTVTVMCNLENTELYPLALKLLNAVDQETNPSD
ncbi:beta-lactamase family protein [Aeoliella sp. ICT_H6.2]|uniref:Beta-lactamase family protein n=1 Tax=Aeoliella straminimaris TaxID=2954799 RepID=A0A9X2FDS6_9BACT|nr:serine hydrolase domain-containing protein [Aeoliella straminimaris]MCO6047100.1 beta-lactamase family protein [Aeoliella straminimaris]